MFTGLIETVGTIGAVLGDSPRRLVVRSALPPNEIKVGDSIAVDGCCLTVVTVGSGELSFEAATETLSRTTIGDLRPGDRVNLERSLQLNSRLDGHLVLGHVDGVGLVQSCQYRGSGLYIGVKAPEEIVSLTAARGSIAIAGVSLTVTELTLQTIYVSLIPHTVQATNLASVAPGKKLNLEADLIARYVARQMFVGRGSLTVETLKDKGFL